jgi:hypothetical protein
VSGMKLLSISPVAGFTLAMAMDRSFFPAVHAPHQLPD